MKNKFFSAFSILFSIYSYAQVGINTNYPKNSLHVEGDARITKIEELSLIPTYVLAPDENGVISKIQSSTLTQGIDDNSGSEIKKLQYYNYDSSKTVTSGIFEFRITGPSISSTANNGNMNYDIRMVKQPKGDVTLTFAGVSRWGGNGGSVAAQNYTRTFNSANWNAFQNIQTITGDLNGHNVMLSVSFANPSDNDSPLFYNLLVQRVDYGLKSLIINRY